MSKEQIHDLVMLYLSQQEPSNSPAELYAKYVEAYNEIKAETAKAVKKAQVG